MRVIREESAPDREAWERGAREAAEKAGYRSAGDLCWRAGAPLATHPDAVRHGVRAFWADGKGRWEATAAACGPRARAVLEGRLDRLQGRPAAGGCAVRTLAAAAAGGLAAWVLAAAAMFILAIPLVRDARDDWAARQERFERRLETARAPIAGRVRAQPLVPAATIPAAVFGFLVAIPLSLWFAAGELFAPLSRLNAAAVGAALLAAPAAFIAPGVPWAGLAAGLAAPLAAWAGYAAVRGMFRDAAPPARPMAWAAGLAALAVAAGAAGAAFRQDAAYSTVRDRLLFGNPAGEALATFYYRHTPLSAYAIRPPHADPRTVALVAGPVPHGFPAAHRHVLTVQTTSKESFLKEASGPGWTFLVFNEEAGPWVVEAAEELRRTHPGRAAGFFGVSTGGLEKALPDADPEQIVSKTLIRDGANPERRPRINRALDLALSRADRRPQLRRVAGVATALSIFLGPPVLLAAIAAWIAAAVAALRSSGRRRTAGIVAALAFAAVVWPLLRFARPEDDLRRRLREVRARCEEFRLAARTDPAAWGRLRDYASKILPDLQSAAKHPDVAVRTLAADALGACGLSEAMPPLGALTEDPSILVRYRAADAFSRFSDNDQRIRWLSLPQNDEIYVAESALNAMLNYQP